MHWGYVNRSNLFWTVVIYDGMTPEELLVRYRQLLEQNKRQRAQIELAETMIDVAEEEFGIAIRKKSGAK